ncbi:MAG: mandelate racemase/muconate lactonizing enzyme family protein [Candidatus Colwellbacteria bacterium]|nr:mandelate racemase/muconate lactonizing enzyme family protein [Candidatus Colwellbacteria bacterium]
MKITKIETINCDAGWRVWTFVKVSTDKGITGWSECTDAFGSTLGVRAVIYDLSSFLIGKDPRLVEKLYWDIYRMTRQSPGGIVSKAIAGIENALLDIKAKELGISVCELFGGPVRDRIDLYWSHCGTTRARAADKANVRAVKNLADIAALAREVKDRGYRAIKTNIILFNDEIPEVYMPGFNRSKGGPELNVDERILYGAREYISVWRSALGADCGIILDANFNFKTEGYCRLARSLEEFGLMWLEVDSYDPAALRDIRMSAHLPICTGETLYSTRDFRPYFEMHAMDVATVDVAWNGFLQSRKIADMAELYEMNIAPHNHHSHLSTMMAAQFAALIPNVRILEIDVDDVPWKDEIVTNVPRIENGSLIIPQGPGWGTEINEEAVRAHAVRR